MTGDEFYTHLVQLGPNDDEGLTALTQKVLEDSRDAPNTAARLWKEGGRFAPQARQVLGELEDVALVPVISQGDPAAVQEVVWALRTMGAQTAELERKIVKYIDAHLGDARKMPVRTDLGPMEEKPPVVRVCDEAYLQMRRLLNVEESTQQYLANSRAFLNLPEDQKNEEIHKAKESRAWTRWTAR